VADVLVEEEALEHLDQRDCLNSSPENCLESRTVAELVVVEEVLEHLDQQDYYNPPRVLELF